MLRAYLTPLLATSLVVTLMGCGVGGVDAADAGADDGDAPPGQPDARPGTSGLTFTFRSWPKDLPSDPEGPNKIVIEQAKMWMRNVRAVGDAAPGDSRTRIEEVTLDYDIGEPGASDTLRIAYPDAPPGVYSFLIAEITRYRMTGTVEVGGDEWEYEIDVEVAPPRSVNVDLEGQDLSSSVPLTVPLISDLRQLTGVINWNQVEEDEGKLEIDNDDPITLTMNDQLGEVHRLDE